MKFHGNWRSGIARWTTTTNMFTLCANFLAANNRNKDEFKSRSWQQDAPSFHTLPFPFSHLPHIRGPIPLNALVRPSLRSRPTHLFPPSLSSTTTYHGASLIRPNSGSRKSPTTGREASGGASERGKNSVIYLTLFINFPFLALVTRLQRSLARWRDLP